MADLVTEARARKHPQLATVDAGLLTALISAASGLVEGYCGREFTSESRTEYYDGDGRAVLLLRQMPVTSLTSIHELDSDDAETEITSGYRLNGDIGELTLKLEYFTPGVQNIKVVYTAGFSTIPAAVQEAVVELIAAFYAEGHHTPGLTAEKLGDYSYSRASADASGLPAMVRTLLQGYRVIRV